MFPVFSAKLQGFINLSPWRPSFLLKYALVRITRDRAAHKPLRFVPLRRTWAILIRYVPIIIVVHLCKLVILNSERLNTSPALNIYNLTLRITCRLSLRRVQYWVIIIKFWRNKIKKSVYQQNGIGSFCSFKVVALSILYHLYLKSFMKDA